MRRPGWKGVVSDRDRGGSRPGIRSDATRCRKTLSVGAEHAVTTYVPPSGSYIEQNIGLKAHLQRVMPVFLTLRDQDGNGLATAMLPPASQDVRSVRPVIVGVGNSDPYPERGAAIWVLGEHVGRVLDQLPADPHLVWVWAMRRDG